MNAQELERNLVGKFCRLKITDYTLVYLGLVSVEAFEGKSPFLLLKWFSLGSKALVLVEGRIETLYVSPFDIEVLF